MTGGFIRQTEVIVNHIMLQQIFQSFRISSLLFEWRKKPLRFIDASFTALVTFPQSREIIS